MRVPVRIKYDTGVSSSQVDAEPASPGTQQENEAVRVRLTETINGSLSQVPTHSAINPLIKVSFNKKKKKHKKHISS